MQDLLRHEAINVTRHFKQNWLHLFHSYETNSQLNDPPWLLKRRRSAFARFLKSFPPETKHERYKNTGINELLETQIISQPRVLTCDKIKLTSDDYSSSGALRIVFVNGCYNAELSSECLNTQGLSILPLKRTLSSNQYEKPIWLGLNSAKDENPFSQLNTALFNDGAFIFVGEGEKVEQPIESVFLTTAEAENSIVLPRLLVVVSARSSISIIEKHISISDAPVIEIPVTEIIAGEHSNIEHVRISVGSVLSWQIGSLFVNQNSNSTVRLNINSARYKGSIVSVSDKLLGENASLNINGLINGFDHEYNSAHTLIEHIAPQCSSNQLFHSLLTDNSRGNYYGTIQVHPNSQKTISKQTVRTILLSAQASMYASPRLMINADDVKCSHAATVGQISSDALFYLRSRGIAEKAAKQMLIESFITQLKEDIHSPGLIAELSKFHDKLIQKFFANDNDRKVNIQN